MMIKNYFNLIIVFYFLIVVYGCNPEPAGNILNVDREAVIYPDYSHITIPSNIAPLNFAIKEKASSCYVLMETDAGSLRIMSSGNEIRFPLKKWKKFLGSNLNKDVKVSIYTRNEDGWHKFVPFVNKIASQPIDKYLTYRILYPGYEAYNDISIRQRDLESFKEHSVVENSILDQNCINCHTFNPADNSDFLIHVRGSHGGTYLTRDGRTVKINPKTAKMANNAVYPRWHPGGRYIAFSSNRTMQYFHSADPAKIEVADVASSLILYDIEKNKVTDVCDSKGYMDTYPEWSPDGKWLYFCRAAATDSSTDYRDIKYNLFRLKFDPSEGFSGSPELLLDAAGMGKSVSFPRISPDGKYLVLTIHGFGCFPIWHKDADLLSIDPVTLGVNKLELNSEFTESYHSWSSNSSWLVFSSKRMDGLHARPFISFIDESGQSTKAFVLPQENPGYYDNFSRTFNIPELSTAMIKLSPRTARKAAVDAAIQAE